MTVSFTRSFVGKASQLLRTAQASSGDTYANREMQRTPQQTLSGLPQRGITMVAKPSVFAVKSAAHDPTQQTLTPLDAGHVQLVTTPDERHTHGNLLPAYGLRPRPDAERQTNGPLSSGTLVVPAQPYVTKAAVYPASDRDTLRPFNPIDTRLHGPELNRLQADKLAEHNAGIFPEYQLDRQNCVAAAHQMLTRLGFDVPLPTGTTAGVTPQLLAALVLQHGPFKLDEQAGVGRAIAKVERLLALRLTNTQKAGVIANLALASQIGRFEHIYGAIAAMLGRQAEFDQALQALRAESGDALRPASQLLAQLMPPAKT